MEQGLSHLSFKVSAKGKNYFVKFLTFDANLLDQDKQTQLQHNILNQQLAMQNLAQQAGFAAKIIEVDPAGKYIVCEYIEGVLLTDVNLTLVAKLKLIAKLLHKCHCLQGSPVKIDLAKITTELLEKSSLSAMTKTKLARHIKQILADVASESSQLVVCHGDLNFSNVLLSEDNTWLLDWEYSIFAEIEYDIAMTISINQITGIDREFFIQQYCKNSNNPVNSLKVSVYIELAHIINALWFLGQVKEPSDTPFLSQKNHFVTSLNEYLA